MDNAKFIQELLPLIGGAKNIKNAITCHTRLRLTLADYSMVQDEPVKALENVMATKMSADQYQVIMGDNVKAVYQELLKYISIGGAADEPRGKRKFNPLGIFAETMSAVFTPLIITICGSGLMMGLQILFNKLGLIGPGDPFYEVLGVLGNVAFYFLPFTVAVSAAERFKCNKYMAIAMVAILMHPTWMALAQGGLDRIMLFGVIPIRLLSYSSAVIPPLLTVYLLSKFEKLLVKFIHPSLGTVLVPFFELLILGPIVLALVGPFSQWASDIIARGYQWLYGVASVPASMLFGGLYPLIVLSGCHLTFVPLMLDSIGKIGVDYIMPLMSIAHCGLAPAALAVFFKTKNIKFKSVAATGAVVTGIGLTEPAMYGVCLPLKKPLVISCIASGLGGLFYGIFHVSALSLGLSPLGSIPLYFTDTFVFWVIGALGTGILAFAGTWLLGYKDGDEQKIPAYADKNK
ncbi:MAG: PTS transporter subunit EIIC [Treponema sp.]|jgi:PTS system beta-glucosides-specific IIC component|nr:PTS transporter subunit EIIC [Treponema sp.]